MQRFLFLTSLIVSLIANTGWAQRKDSLTLVSLDSVVVSAYGGGSLMATPAAVNKIGAAQLQRFNGASILQAVNTTSGVRMEERSPGSYRFNIRGSAVRSPYGVRNVKVYYGEIPFTAPGGNTLLNMLGVQNIGSVEVIKGPGSSLYGAGNGGVILFEPPQLANQPGLEAGVSAGSFGMLNYHVKLQAPAHQLSFEQVSADGYRTHTAMKRNVLAYQTQLPTFTNAALQLHVIYSDLNYETPGALTLAEYERDPKQARPAVGNSQGAITADAGIKQQAVLLGLSHRYAFSNQWSNSTSLYGFYNAIENPAIQNYELKKEPHWGGRSTFSYHTEMLKLQMGAELQQGEFSSNTFQNLQGSKGNQITDDKLSLWQWLAFAQLQYQLDKLSFTAGASINYLALQFLRSSESPNINAAKNFSGQLQPRFAILYQASENFSAFMNVTKGFSPPASSEIFADNNTYNLALQPESGWNIEPGLRWKFLQNRLFFETSYFRQVLNNAIVTRRDAAGANYFINAGKTKQQGIETSAWYHLTKKENPLLVNIQAAYTWHHFVYVDFTQLGQNFSGNRLPGVPQSSLAFALDVKHRSGIFAFLSANHQSKVALNDANSEYATPFEMLSVKLGYQSKSVKFPLQFFVGADNLLDQNYSLGNDINGFGGRYYNAAPGRSFYLGVKLSWLKQ